MDTLKIALKDIKSLKKEKTILIVIALFFFVSAFSSIFTLGFALFYSPAEDTKIGLVGNAPIFEEVINPIRYGTLDAALSEFHNGNLDAIVLLEENVSRPNILTIFLPTEEIRAIKVSASLKEKLIEYQNRLRTMRNIPVPKVKMYMEGREVKISIVCPLYFKFVYLMLIPILAIATAALSASFLIDSLTEEFETRTMDILVSVVKLSDVIIGKVLVAIFISLFLTVSWIVMLTLNGIAIYNGLMVMAMCTSISLFLISLSLLSSLSRDRERAQLIFSLTASILIVLSFSIPHSFINLLSRVSANSYFGGAEILAYLSLSIITLGILVLASIKKGY